MHNNRPQSSKYSLGREAVVTNHRQIIANTDTQLIIIIIILFTLFTRITLNVFGKALCPCHYAQSTMPFWLDSNLKITHNSCLNIYYDNFRKLFRPLVQRLTTLFHLPDRMC